ncbi:hypothetical protein ACWGJB_28320 [Streptomyces sp. NPDC054813]
MEPRTGGGSVLTIARHRPTRACEKPGGSRDGTRGGPGAEPEDGPDVLLHLLEGRPLTAANGVETTEPGSAVSLRSA